VNDPAPYTLRVITGNFQYGSSDDSHARALVSGKSRLLGLIVSEITNPFFPEIVDSFEEIAVAHNYEILLASTVHDPNRMQSSVRRLLERQAEGVAILTFGFEDRLIEDFRYRNVPLVFVDVGPDLPGVTNIRINYMNGIREAVQHLAALRHERIAFVTGPLQMKSATARKTAFERSMREIGLAVTPELIVAGDHTMEGGMRALIEIACLPSRPSAILCSNDMTAIGIMRQAYDYGISVPDELSVIGFDNIRLSEFMIPPLTTVQMSQTELAKRAFEALVRVLNDKTVHEKPQKYVLNTSLVLRRSTALSSSNRVSSLGLPNLILSPGEAR
jgi:DNA-binding LacI/PurR family transcriptional regulator